MTGEEMDHHPKFYNLKCPHCLSQFCDMKCKDRAAKGSEQ